MASPQFLFLFLFFLGHKEDLASPQQHLPPQQSVSASVRQRVRAAQQTSNHH
jgi:hypothetical protein